MSRQWSSRSGPRNPGSFETSPFAPRPFTPKTLPSVSQPAAEADEKPEEKAEEQPPRERPPLITWSVAAPLQTWPLQTKAPAHQPEPPPSAEIHPIEGSSPSAPLLQFTLQDARKWVKDNRGQSGYPAGWNPIPLKSQIEKYIEDKKEGSKELEAEYTKPAEDKPAKEPSRKRKTASESDEPADPDPKKEKLDVNAKDGKDGKDGKDAKDEKDVKDGKEEKKRDDVATVRQIFLDVMGELKVVEDIEKAIVVDLDLESYEPEALLFLKETKDHKEIASCFDTAQRLFDLVGDPASDASASWATEAPMKTALPQLIQDMKDHKGSACIYRCGVAKVAHGFTIILQGDKAELVQGFAGPEGQSLAENLESSKGGTTIGELAGTLENLLDSEGTLDAQNHLFAGSIDIEKVRANDRARLEKARSNESWREADPDDYKDDEGRYVWFYRDLKEDVFQFERRGLYSQEQLRARILQKVRRNLAIFKKKR